MKFKKQFTTLLLLLTILCSYFLFNTQEVHKSDPLPDTDRTESTYVLSTDREAEY